MEEIAHMDPSTWSTTPMDIIFLIIEASDRATQIKWSSTCQVFYNYTCPRIWSDLRISCSDIDGYAGYPELWSWPGGIERYGKIHFMAEHASRESKLTRMNSCIRTLIVDIRPNQTQALSDQAVVSQLSLDFVIPTLLPLLPNLTACVFDGALYCKTLSQLVKVSTLKRLELRADDWYLQQGDSDPDESHSWVWRRWFDLSLNFKVLANLQSLQSLKIGRLHHEEAKGLAKVVAKLRLIDLEIHSSPWVSDDDLRRVLAGRQWFDSPLMFFLYFLGRRHGPGLLPRALPSTLETLILRDRFHPFTQLDAFAPPTKHLWIRTACRNCRSLRRIEFTHPTRDQACNFISTFGWRPLEERFGNTKLASLEVSEHPPEEIYNGVAEFQHMPSPGLWEFAFVRDPNDVLESTEAYAESMLADSAALMAKVTIGNGKINTEFRTVILEKLDRVQDDDEGEAGVM